MSQTHDHTHGNSDAMRSILDHHAALASELGRRTQDLLEAVRDGGDPKEARRALAGFLDDELMPHAAAEERTLYQAGRREPQASLLIVAMAGEHALLAERLAALRDEDDPITLATTAAEIRALFTSHLGKENDLLLPLLIESGADLPALLQDTHHLLDHSFGLDQSA
jgi:iron-sulfur cluster repair protein YtfE (RIC family)